MQAVETPQLPQCWPVRALLAADNSDPIIIPIHNWSSQIAMSNVIRIILEAEGNAAEHVTTDSHAVCESIHIGDLTLGLDVWKSAFGALLRATVAKGGIEDAATHSRHHPRRLVVFDVDERGLPWPARLAGAERVFRPFFVMPEIGAKGRFLDGPVDWLKHDAEKAKALRMHFQVVNARSAAAIWAELTAAEKDKTPIVSLNFTPNFAEAVWPGEFIEFPAWEDGCDTARAVGPVPDKLYDCVDPADGCPKISAWDGKNKWPKAFTTLQEVSFTSAQIAEMSKLAHIDDIKPEDAAQVWLDAN